MSAFSASTGSLHRDSRSESRSYKRDKEHAAKWAFGTRGLPGNSTRLQSIPHGEWLNDHEDLPKVRPEKRWSDRRHGNSKTHANVNANDVSNFSRIGDTFGRAAARVSRKQNAKMEISSSISVPSPLVDSIYFAQPSPMPTPDASVVYPSDVKIPPPQEFIGLENLVEKAEEAFNNRETARIVRDEYEILDAKGDTVRRGKKGSPKQVAQILVENDDDWEQI